MSYPIMPIVNHVYEAAIIRPVDGDTFVGRIRLAPWNIEQEGRIRLAGLNCPELRTPEGVVAAQFTADWLTKTAATGAPWPPWPLIVVAPGVDNYGRILASIYRKVDGACLNADLLAANMAVTMKLSAQLAAP